MVPVPRSLCFPPRSRRIFGHHYPISDITHTALRHYQITRLEFVLHLRKNSAGHKSRHIPPHSRMRGIAQCGVTSRTAKASPSGSAAATAGQILSQRWHRWLGPTKLDPRLFCRGFAHFLVLHTVQSPFPGPSCRDRVPGPHTSRGPVPPGTTIAVCLPISVGHACMIGTGQSGQHQLHEGGNDTPCKLAAAGMRHANVQ